jgi:hypothetical protein
METQSIDNLPATKGDIQMLLSAIEENDFSDDIQMILDALHDQSDFGIETPENPTLRGIWKRLDLIDTAVKKAIEMGMHDLPVDVETAAALTGLAIGTVRNYGTNGYIDTIRIGRKLQFSLKGCVKLVEKGARKAVIDCTSEITGYHRARRKRKKAPKLNSTV